MHDTSSLQEENQKYTAKFSENLYIKGCDNIWYRWQTFSYGEYGLNMNEQWDVTSTALRGINMTKTTWGTLKHKPFSGWANCSKEVLLEISTACLLSFKRLANCLEIVWKHQPENCIDGSLFAERSSWNDNWVRGGGEGRSGIIWEDCQAHRLSSNQYDEAIHVDNTIFLSFCRGHLRNILSPSTLLTDC